MNEFVQFVKFNIPEIASLHHLNGCCEYFGVNKCCFNGRRRCVLVVRYGLEHELEQTLANGDNLQYSRVFTPASGVLMWAILDKGRNNL